MENKYIIKQTKTPNIIIDLLYSKFQAHVFHWQAKNGDVHRALGDYYGAISDLVDGLVESYQGKYGVITKFTCDCTLINSRDTSEYVKYFTSLALKLSKDRETIGEDSYLQNVVDEILSLIYTTIYKLKELT